MRYLTAIEASKRIGVAEKTIRLWIKEGKLKAHHPAKNRLAIAEADVERIAKERQLYYGAKPEIPSPIHTLPDVSAHDIDTLFTRIAQLENQPEISVLTRELGKLQAKVDVQQARIDELERRIAELEARNHPVIAENVPVVSVPVQPSQNTTPPKVAQKRNVAPNIPIPSDLPPGTLHSSDFADQLGIKRTVFDSMMKNGIGGEELERTKIPIVARPGTNKNYFNPQEQQKALELLRKHGKLPGA